MATVQEAYTPTILPGDANFPGARGVGSFICVTAGFLTLKHYDSNVDFLSLLPVSAGVVYPLLFSTPGGFIADLSGGATGTIGTW